MQTELKVAQIFTDHMVFQRESEVPIWGQTVDNTEIWLEFCGQSHKTKAVKGEWCIWLSPLKSGGPFEMRIWSGRDEVVLYNIMVGEVWVAGGQSNIEFNLKLCQDGIEEIDRSYNEQIRFFDVPKISFEEPGSDLPKVHWKLCNPENSGVFSAVAYHFARKLQDTLQVPVGIIG